MSNFYDSLTSQIVDLVLVHVGSTAQLTAGSPGCKSGLRFNRHFGEKSSALREDRPDRQCQEDHEVTATEAKSVHSKPRWSNTWCSSTISTQSQLSTYLNELHHVEHSSLAAFSHLRWSLLHACVWLEPLLMHKCHTVLCSTLQPFCKIHRVELC